MWCIYFVIFFFVKTLRDMHWPGSAAGYKDDKSADSGHFRMIRYSAREPPFLTGGFFVIF